MNDYKNLPLSQLNMIPEAVIDTFLEDEVKFGFYIPAIIKQFWAAEIKVLSFIDRVCEKHNISYFVDAGTMLGAIRHGGFIPWDDDLDIVMLREDYEKFLKVYDEHPEDFHAGLEVRNNRNFAGYRDFHSVVTGLGHISFDTEHLQEYYGFPYIVAIDIFVLDKKCESYEKQQELVKNVLFTIAVADEIESGSLKGTANINLNLDKIRKFPGAEKLPVYVNQNPIEFRSLLYEYVEKIIEASGSDKSGKLVKMFPGGVKYLNRGIESSFYEKSALVPFEYTLVPVVGNYSRILRYEYGDYLRIRKGTGGHDYPCFSVQERDFKGRLDFEIPEFKFESAVLERIKIKRTENRNNSWKEILKEGILQLEGLLDNIGECIGFGRVEEALNMIADCQQLAIDTGNFIENVKGPDLPVIGLIENFCEKIFYLYNCVSSENEEFDKTFETAKNACGNVAAELNQILAEKEYLFIIFKNQGLEFLEKEMANAEKEANVKVMRIPYYHKTFDGQIKGECNDNICYQTNFDYVSQEDYDINFLHPDRIYFQFPYDNWNPVMTVNSAFFTENLAVNTEELVYIPWFETDDFGVEDVDYLNCKYYVCMPGVTYSDRVVLSSEAIRNIYIRKLTEFAGKETESLWEDRIKTCSNNKVENVGVKKEKKLFVCLSDEIISSGGEKGIALIGDVLNTLSECGDVRTALYIDDVDGKYLSEEYRGYNLELKKLVNSVSKSERVELFTGRVTPEEAAKNFDAFYGVPGRYAVCFSYYKKPTMICDMEKL